VSATTRRARWRDARARAIVEPGEARDAEARSEGGGDDADARNWDEVIALGGDADDAGEVVEDAVPRDGGIGVSLPWRGMDVGGAFATFAKPPTVPLPEFGKAKKNGGTKAPKVTDAEKLKQDWGDTLSWDQSRVDGTALNGKPASSPDIFDSFLGMTALDVEELETLERQRRAKRIAKELERRRKKRERDAESQRRKVLEQARLEAKKQGKIFASGDFDELAEELDIEDETEKKKDLVVTLRETYDAFVSSDVAKWTVNFFVIPSIISRLVTYTIIDPIVSEELKLAGADRTTIELRDDQEAEILAKLNRFQQRIDYEVIMGRQAPLPAIEREKRVKEEARRLEEEAIQEFVEVDGNRYGDLVFFAAFLIMIVVYNEQAKLVVTGSKNAFFSLEPAQQAFLLLLSSDVLVGYHSADAWQTLLRAIGGHYGFPEEENLISLFVAIVPVSVDVLFKFWVFKYLRRLAPSTQVILEDIDRH